jgi:hypothetical protein
MSLGQPVSEFSQHTCPKCGAVQESPGSTVCEQCGADLKPTVVTSSSSLRPAPQLKQSAPKQSLKQPPRIGQILGAPIRIIGAPIRFVRSALEALMSLVFSILSLVWRLISLTIRIALTLAVIGSIVVGLSYVPEVRARVPVMKEVPGIAKQGLSTARRTGVNLVGTLAGLATSRTQEQPKQRVPSPRATTQQRRASQPAVKSKPTAASKKPAPARAVSTYPVTLKSTPAGATVYLDGRQIGKTPLTLKFAPGTYKITISSPGYSSVTRTIIVKAGKTAFLSVTLTKVRTIPRRPAPTPTPVPPPKTPSPREP